MGWPKEAYLHLRQIVTPKSRPQPGGNLLYTKSDNNLYLLNADGTEHQVGGGGGGSLTVQDENANVSTSVTQIDFQGAGVTASAGTGEVVVTVPGETLPVTIIDAKGDLIVGTADNTAARLPATTDGYVLTLDSAQTAGMKWAAAAGGGSNTVKDPRWNVLSGQTTIDEFNDSSLDAAWVRVDGASAPAANITWAEGADVVSALSVGSDASDAFHALVRPLGTSLSTGDAIVTCFTIQGLPGTSTLVAHLLLADGATYGSGKQLVAQSYTSASPASAQANGLFNWTNYTTAGTGNTEANSAVNVPTYMRIVYLGSTNFRLDRSGDGVSWIKGTNLSVASFTPTYLGVGIRQPGATNKVAVSFEFVRRASGIT